MSDDFNQRLIANMSPEVYRRMQQCVETGRWLDGNAMTSEQRDAALQAVMLYQATCEQSEQHMTVNAQGEVVYKSKQQLQNEFTQADTGAESGTIAKFSSDDI